MRHPNQLPPSLAPAARNRGGGVGFHPYWHPSDLDWVDLWNRDRMPRGSATDADRAAIASLRASEDPTRQAREDREDGAARLYAALAATESLTPTERDILALIARGLTLAEAARSRGVSKQSAYDTYLRAVARVRTQHAPPPPAPARRRRPITARARRAARWGVLARARRRRGAPPAGRALSWMLSDGC